jgi:hypothetical protein
VPTTTYRRQWESPIGRRRQQDWNDSCVICPRDKLAKTPVADDTQKGLYVPLGGGVYCVGAMVALAYAIMLKLAYTLYINSIIFKPLIYPAKLVHLR